MMKTLLTFIFLLTASQVLAQERAEMGERFCRISHGSAVSARGDCYREWLRTARLSIRYFHYAGVTDENGGFRSTSFSDLFSNPFKLSPRRVVDKCLASQLWQGNLFDGIIDFTDVWECISDIDPVASGWDTF